MNAATIVAIVTGAPAIIGAVTALVIALKSKGTAQDASRRSIDSYSTAQQAIGLANSNKDALQDHIDHV